MPTCAVPEGKIVAMATSLPESLQFLAVRKTRSDALVKWLRQLDPRLRIDNRTVFVANEESKASVPLVHLFRGGRAGVTLLFWVVNFVN